MATSISKAIQQNVYNFSKDDDEKKAPKGFEKFLKKTREGGPKSSKDAKKEESKKDKKAS